MIAPVVVPVIDAGARGAFALATVALLLMAVAGLLARRAPQVLASGAAQGAVLAAAVLAQAWLQASTWLLAAATLVAAARAVAMPILLRQVPLEGAVRLRRTGLAVAASALVALAAWLGASAPAEGVGAAGGIGVVVPLALALVGCLGVAMRQDSQGRLSGVMALETAAILAASGVPGLPGVALLVLCSNALSAAAVMLLVRRALLGGAP